MGRNTIKGALYGLLLTAAWIAIAIGCARMALGSSIVTSAYNVVNSGGALPKQSTLTFTGAITCVNNAGARSTDCTVATGAGGVSSIGQSGTPLTGAVVLATGTAGTNFAVATAGQTITFNLPDASAANRGAITTGTQTIAGDKTFNGNIIATSFVQNTTTLTLRSTIAAATAGTSLSSTWSAAKTITSGTNITHAAVYNFAPTSGTGVMIGFGVTGTVNQTSTATGSVSQFNSTPVAYTSVYDFRHYDYTSGTVNLLSTAPDQQAVRFPAMTYAAGSSKTVTNIATLRIDGPIAGSNVTITNPYAIWVDSGNSQFDGWINSAVYTRVPPVAVGSLPTCNAAAAGARATVNDALAPVALANVAAGGAVTVGVLCDGGNWIVQ